MNDLYEDLRRDPLDADPALTRAVVDRWLAHRRRARRWITTLVPLAAAAALLFSVLLVHQLLETRARERRLAASRAVAVLMRDAQPAAAFTPDRVTAAVDALDADLLLSLFSSESPEHTP